MFQSTNQYSIYLYKIHGVYKPTNSTWKVHILGFMVLGGIYIIIYGKWILMD